MQTAFTIALYAAILVGVVAGIIIWSRSPWFWAGLVRAMVVAALPALWALIKPRTMTPEERHRNDLNEDINRPRKKGW